MKKILLFAAVFFLCALNSNAQKADLSSSNELILEKQIPSNVLDQIKTQVDFLKKEKPDFRKSPPIFEQHDLITQEGAGTGGADISELQSGLGMGTYGFGFQIASTNSIADDFTVAPGETWTINAFQFYGYQTNSPTEPSSFDSVIVRIYDGDPSVSGVVIQDFWGINNLDSTAWTGIYRVNETDITAVNRPIMFLYCEVPEFTLTEGTYWVEWSANGTGASGPWSPAVTIVGTTDTGDGFQNVSGVWGPMLDNSTYPQGATFDIYGSISVQGSAPVTFIVDNTSSTSYTGFALKGSWDASGNYDATWNGGLEHTDFYDDGTHGDLTPDDDIWSVVVDLVPDGGVNNWEWGINDQDGNWIDGNFGFSVIDDSPFTLSYATLDIKGIDEKIIGIFPNPSNGVFNVLVEENFNLELFDIAGRLINTQLLTGNQTVEIDAAGVYFFRFSNEQGSVTQRVIVQ